MSFRDLDRLFLLAAWALVTLPVLAFAVGWYCGDHYDLPHIDITWNE